MLNTDKENVYKFILDVLSLSEKYDIREELFWRTDNEYAPVTFWVNVNDVFYWGCADLEKITPENFPELLRAIEDVKLTGSFAFYGTYLFAARQRNLRPQGACYRSYPKELHVLFDAAGPPREIDLANPYNQEHQYLYKKP